jgi:hypothetical protein
MRLISIVFDVLGLGDGQRVTWWATRKVVDGCWRTEPWRFVICPATRIAALIGTYRSTD